MYLANQQIVKEALGEDLWELLNRFESSVEEVTCLTTLLSNNLNRKSFKVKLADGQVYKARNFPTVHEAAAVGRLAGFFEPFPFPKVIAFHRKALLSEWVAGQPLRFTDNVDWIFKKAGAVQGLLHSLVLHKDIYPPAHCDIRYWQVILEQRLDYLIEKEMLTMTDKQAILDAAAVNCADVPAVGLTHGDYCAQNMILDEKGRLCIVDLESISVTSIAYDLARTIYRWEMNSAQRRLYFKSYSEYYNPGELLKNLSFWIISVLVQSAAFRVQGQISSQEKPLGILKAVIQEHNEAYLENCFGMEGLLK